jgi:hypothetical protein
VNITKVSYVAAPALMAGYGVVRLVSGHHGPGLGWTAGHLLMLGALVMFGWVIGGLRRLAPGVVANVCATIASVGLVSVIVQIGLDLVVGAISADAAEQSRLFGQIQAVPGVLPLVYTVVPLLLQLGILAQSIVAAAGRGPRRAPWWTPVLILAGTVAGGLGLDYIPVAGLLYLLALAPLAPRAPRVATTTV